MEASLTNLEGASISKSFAPNPIASGLGNYSITIIIRSTANVTLTNMAMVDSLPLGLEIAGGSAPALTNNCGGTVTNAALGPLAAGDTVIRLSGGPCLSGLAAVLLLLQLRVPTRVLIPIQFRPILLLTISQPRMRKPRKPHWY